MTNANLLTPGPAAGAPERQAVRFTRPESMVTFFILDRLVADIKATAGQLHAVGQVPGAEIIAGLGVSVAQMRDQVLRQDQGGIVLAGAMPGLGGG